MSRFSTYEVLLRRGNGLNKTVYIHDCMSDQEARETAEAMYGMEVLRVLWKGRTDDWENRNNSSVGSVSNNNNNKETSTMTFTEMVGAILVLALLFFLFVIYEMLLATWAFIVAYWPWILGISILAFLIWAWFLPDEEENEQD